MARSSFWFSFLLRQETAQEGHGKARDHDHNDFEEHVTPGIIIGSIKSVRIKESVKFKVNHDPVLYAAKRGNDHAPFSENEHAHIDNDNKVEK